ncbi:MAG: thermonuclease family protein [Candidatus Peribacteraceae bacterium]|jgi:micrococcal nuclease
MRRFVILLLPLFLVACASRVTAHVVNVVDGDTIDVRMPGGSRERVRIVGIDTPETKDPRKPVQCFGKEASDRMKEILLGNDVVLEKKPDENKDKYGRLLRYVSLNGEDVGASLIRDGYAFSYKVFPHPRLELYNALERKAEEEEAGLWGGDCQYSGD